MTREEAINAIKEHIDTYHIIVEIEALEMAIEALEQEECEDCISRKEALKLFEDRFIELQKVHQKDKQYGVNWCINTLKDLPSVNPQKIGHWIIVDATHSKCDRCWAVFEITSPNGEVNYCPNCGAQMVEPPESEDQNDWIV